MINVHRIEDPEGKLTKHNCFRLLRINKEPRRSWKRKIWESWDNICPVIQSRLISIGPKVGSAFNSIHSGV